MSDTAYFKCQDVVKTLHQKQTHFDLVISADTVVVLDNVILEKPENAQHAKTMLKSLSNNTHSVITAVVLAMPDPKSDEEVLYHRFYETTQVTFSEMADGVIDAYVATGTPMYVPASFNHSHYRDKAGGYGIQEVEGGSFVSSIEGCYYNVTGFPVNRFCREMLSLFNPTL